MNPIDSDEKQSPRALAGALMLSTLAGVFILIVQHKFRSTIGRCGIGTNELPVITQTAISPLATTIALTVMVAAAVSGPFLHRRRARQILVALLIMVMTVMVITPLAMVIALMFEYHAGRREWVAW